MIYLGQSLEILSATPSSEPLESHTPVLHKREFPWSHYQPCRDPCPSGLAQDSSVQKRGSASCVKCSCTCLGFIWEQGWHCVWHTTWFDSLKSTKQKSFLSPNMNVISRCLLKIRLLWHSPRCLLHNRFDCLQSLFASNQISHPFPLAWSPHPPTPPPTPLPTPSHSQKGEAKEAFLQACSVSWCGMGCTMSLFCWGVVGPLAESISLLGKTLHSDSCELGPLGQFDELLKLK